MIEMQLRPMADADRFAVAELIYASINTWYLTHGRPQIFYGGPAVTEVFYDVYHELSPGGAIIAQNTRTGQLMGSCFFHERERHVSLGIMTVHPNYYGSGAGGALLRYITEFADRHRKPVRLTQSAINVESFSLYNRGGFVPRYSYQDMFVPVPDAGLPFSTPGLDRVRPATEADIPAMASLEEEVSGITREPDYRYCLANRLGFWSVAVIESPNGGLDGWMISSGHAAMNLLGPCIARTEEAAAALILHGLNLYPGRAPVFLVPMEKERLVRQAYAWGARNCEMHFCQVRGEFRPFRGVNMPSFLPETG